MKIYRNPIPLFSGCISTWQRARSGAEKSQVRILPPRPRVRFPRSPKSHADAAGGASNGSLLDVRHSCLDKDRLLAPAARLYRAHL